MKTIITGSFDPVTVGHIDIISRAAAVFESVEVVIFENVDKKYTFSLNDRLDMLSASCKKIKNVSVSSNDGLVADYCMKNGISVIVRGVRDATDMSYESTIAAINRSLGSHPDTVFFPAKAQLAHISSTFARDLIKHKKSLVGVVPDEAIEILKEKM